MANKDVYPYSAARQLFPTMPEEIFDLWFDDRIEANEWPAIGPVWDAALRHKSIIYWQGLTWSKQTLALQFANLTAPTQKIISELTLSSFYNKSTDVGRHMGNQSTEKLCRILNYVQTHRRLPNPLIFILDGSLYEIVDGCHRLALFLYLRSNSRTSHLIVPYQEAWVGNWKGDRQI
jgi:hypothetical protein